MGPWLQICSRGWRYDILVVSRGFFGPLLEHALTEYEYAAIDHVVGCLKNWTGASLSELTHSEAPWLNARIGLAPNARSRRTVSCEAMSAYYQTKPQGNPVFALVGLHFPICKC